MFSADESGVLRRCFIAALPDAPAREHLLAWQRALRDALGPAFGQPTQPVDLHLTLVFLGDLDRATAEALLSAWPSAGPDARLPALDFVGLRRWGGRQSVWVAEFEAEPLWTDVHQAWSALMLRHGIGAGDTTFRPHVTLGRGKLAAGSSKTDAPTFKWPATSLRFDRLAMMARAHGEEAARYRVVRTLA